MEGSGHGLILGIILVLAVPGITYAVLADLKGFISVS
jgi:hypothetical protein